MSNNHMGNMDYSKGLEVTQTRNGRQVKADILTTKGTETKTGKIIKYNNNIGKYELEFDDGTFGSVYWTDMVFLKGGDE